jgi:hypothetical protein
MANWKRTLTLLPEYDDCDPDNGLDIRALASIVAVRLSKLKPFHDIGTAEINQRRLSLVAEFKALAADVNTDKDDFNRVMVWLYQWGDQTLPHPPGVAYSEVPKVCWISTQEGM